VAAPSENAHQFSRRLSSWSFRNYLSIIRTKDSAELETLVLWVSMAKTRRTLTAATTRFTRADGTLDGEALLTAWRCGRSWPELAESLGVRTTTVYGAAYRVAQRTKASWPPKRNAVPPSRIDQLAPAAFDLRRRGVSFRRMSRMLRCADHIARAAVRLEAERRGVLVPAARDRNAGRRLDCALAFRLRLQGHEWKEIAKRVGASSRTSVHRATLAYARTIGESLPVAVPRGVPARIDGVRALRLRKKWRMNWTQIAKKLDCTHSGARMAAERAAKKRGVALEPRQRRVRIDGAKVAECRRRRMPWISIASRLRCSKSGAKNALLLLQKRR
jgi:hypothetical protein